MASGRFELPRPSGHRLLRPTRLPFRHEAWGTAAHGLDRIGQGWKSHTGLTGPALLLGITAGVTVWCRNPATSRCRDPSNTASRIYHSRTPDEIGNSRPHATPTVPRGMCCDSRGD